MKIFLITLIFTVLTHTGNLSDNDPNLTLDKLFKDYDEFNMRTYPEWATYEGDHRFDDLLTDNSESAILAGYDSTQTFLDKLTSLDYQKLNYDNKVNYDLFKNSLEDNISSKKFNWYTMPIGQQHGIHIDFPQLIHVQPLDTYEDYQKYFKRLYAFGNRVDNTISNMRKGIVLNNMPPDFIMEQTLPQMENVINPEAEASVFYSPLKKENKLSSEEKILAENELKKIITEEINPSYRKLFDFVKNEYLPECRKEAGIWSLKNGKEIYERQIKDHTTLDLIADEIHNIGLKEVNRILQLMENLKDSIGYKGTPDEFNYFLKTDPQFYYTDKKDLVNGFKNILKTMDAKLPELFGRLPEAKYDFREMEEFRAESAPAAYYYSAPEDRSRPAYFYINTYNLPARPKYTMTALALHEAVPGHHLQISIAQELENLPRFRRNLGVTAFMEGWALYAESLGYETGMYDDLYQRYGALTFEMWRACRLVVDTGIHDKRWTREQAFDFMKKYTPNSDADIKSEIDRYISWPGQALAYKLGEIKIKELRAKSEKALGEKFDIKKFHDEILKNGAIPLSLLEKNIDQWTNAQK